MSENFNSGKIDKRFTGNYSPEEQNDKYRFQKRWQEKNGYIVKSYRINENTKKQLLKFAKENKKTLAKVLQDAFEYYKTNLKSGYNSNKLTAFLESLTPDEKKKCVKLVQDKKCSDKKDFKIKKVLADEIDAACQQSGYSYGYFITEMLDKYMEEENKTKNKSINEQNRNP